MTHHTPTYIASGFYYHVYRTSDTRVEKRPTSFMRKAWLLWWWHIVPRTRLVPEILHIPVWTAGQMTLTTRLRERLTAHANLLGNPSALQSDGSYTQDFAPALGTLLPTLSEAQIYAYVHDYIRIQHLLWRHGFAERVWNFTLNCGVRQSDGTLILTDINELTEDKAEALEHLRIHRWQVKHSMRRIKKTHPHLWQRLSRLFEEKCTAEKLESVWPAKDDPAM